MAVQQMLTITQHISDPKIWISMHDHIAIWGNLDYILALSYNHYSCLFQIWVWVKNILVPIFNNEVHMLA